VLYVKKHGDLCHGTEGFCGFLDILARLKLLDCAMKSSPALVAALAATSLVALNPSCALAQSAQDCPAIKATLL
jgi:hypothetical protein